MQRGQRIEDRYEVIETLGHGGTATVYRVRHLSLGIDRALKLLYRSGRGLVARMRQEARVLAHLRHPNIVSVEDTVQVGDQPGIVMPYIQGCRSLRDLLDEGPLPYATFVGIGEQVIDGVAAAHAHGVVHRDLKPENVLIDRIAGRYHARVCDFGLAKVLDDGVGGALTRQGAVMGTPSYMSPEQLTDLASVDARSDVFALGALLFELASGRKAFTGRDVTSIIENVRAGNHRSLDDLRPGLPRAMVSAIDEAMTTDRDRRRIALDDLRRRWRTPTRAQRPRRSRTPPTAQRPPHPSGIPQPLKALHGRATLQARATATLQGRARLVTFHGPGGAGKSLLAQHVGVRVQQGFPGGAWWVDCGLFADIAALAAHLRTLRGGKRLGTRAPALLVIDGFEGLVRGGEPLITSLLRRGPALTILLTSRVRTLLPGERVIRVGGLDAEAGAALLRDRASAAGTRIARMDAAALRQVSERVDGLPLALELAAPRLRTEDVSRLVRSLDDPLAVLRERRTRRPPRHRSLTAVLDASWANLAPATRLAWCQLSVFRGPFSFDDATAVIDLSALDGRVDDELARLHDHALLVRSGGGGRTALTMLGIVRTYASRRLHDPDAVHGTAGEPLTGPAHGQAALARLVDHVTRPATRVPQGHICSGQPRGPGAPALLDLYAACAHHLAAGNSDGAARACIAAWQVVERRGGFADLVGNAVRALRLGGSELTRFQLHRLLTAACLPLGREVDAQVNARHAADLAHALDCTDLRALVATDGAAVALALGRDREALQHAAAAVALARTPITAAWARLRLAEVGVVLDTPDPSLLAEADAALRALGDAHGLARARNLWARIALDDGDLALAARRAHDAAAQHHDQGRLRLEGEARVFEARALAALGVDRALDQATAALRLLRDTGDKPRIVEAESTIAAILCQRGEQQTASGRLTAARARLGDLPPPAAATLAVHQAEALMASGQPGRARQLARIARQLLAPARRPGLNNRLSRIDRPVHPSGGPP